MILYNGLGCYSAPCLGMGKRDARGAKLLVWGFQLGRSVLFQVPCSECTSDLVVQMSKASGWVTTCDTVGINLVPVLFVASPSLLPNHSQIPNG